MKPFSPIADPRDIRKRLSMNQSEFWSRIGVTQSGGSRYESGRSLPKPVRELVRLVYLRDVPLEIANGADLRVAALLKKQKPELYRELLKQSSSSKKRS
jgi:transcriptional regulator with XRE-family HTH domain